MSSFCSAVQDGMRLIVSFFVWFCSGEEGGTRRISFVLSGIQIPVDTVSVHVSSGSQTVVGIVRVASSSPH